MSQDALVVAPLVVAGVFALSGWGKLGDDDRVAAQDWSDLGVPSAWNTRWMRRIHPFAELALCAALLVAPGALAVAAGVAAALLCAAYLALIARAAAGPEPASCACFGAEDRVPITARTVARNAVLFTLAVLAVVHAVAVGSPLSTLVDAPASTWWWLLAAAVVGLTVHLFEPTVAPAAADDVEHEIPAGFQAAGVATVEGDYLRTLTPHATLVDEAGRIQTLVDMSAAQAQFLVFLSPGCLSCLEAGEQVPTWQARMPEISVRIVVSVPADALRSALPDWMPYALFDETGDAARVLRASRTPTAVLLGTDGMLAGGPAAGGPAIGELVEEIVAELEHARDAGLFEVAEAETF